MDFADLHTPRGQKVLKEAMERARSGPPVTRHEYDELFLAITRLTDRIEALEKS